MPISKLWMDYTLPSGLLSRPILTLSQNHAPTCETMVTQSDPKTLGSPATGNLDAPNSGFLPKNPFPSPAAATASPTHDAPQQRRFIIFDHSGNLTTFVFSSVAPPIHKPNPKQHPVSPLHAHADLPSSTGVVDHSSISRNGAAGESSNEEDADEIDALLCSDSDDYDNEQSTGQFNCCNIPDGLEEEVASSGRPTKRRRQWEEGESDASLADTASSPHARIEEGDGSSCVEGNAKWEEDDRDGEEETSVAGAVVKRVKRDRIYEAVCLLRGIVPGCSGKADAVVVLDEAIRYLKSLEFKAKAFGIAL